MKILIIVILIISFNHPAQAVPTVTGISGALTHNSNAIVNGSGFGSKSPVAPLLWDPVDGMYAGITHGAVVPQGTGRPWRNVYQTHFKTTNPRGKFTAKYTNTWSTNGSKRADVGGNNYPTATDTLYVSWWMYSSTGTFFVRNLATGIADISNKFTRFTASDGWSDAVQSVIWAPSIISWFNQTTPTNNKVWADSSNTYGHTGWMRMEEIIVNSAPIWPEGYFYLDGVSKTKLTPTHAPWSLARPITMVAALGADNSNTPAAYQPDLDWGEIYVDDTRARVEICNATPKSASTHCEIQIPQTSWANSQINVKVNQGSFPNNSPAYLYVVDHSGGVSQIGYPIRFDVGALPDTTPPTVISTFPLNNATNITKNSLITFNLSEPINCPSVQATLTPGNETVSCLDGTVTITPIGQTDGTNYTATLLTTTEDMSGNNLATAKVIVYTTKPAVVPTCSTDKTLCLTPQTCSAAWPTYFYCPERSPACDSAACAVVCSSTTKLYCDNSTECEAAEGFYWERACRDFAEPAYALETNLLINSNLGSGWLGDLPVGWSTDTPTTIHRDPFGIRLSGASGIYQAVLKANTKYFYAYNQLSGSGVSGVYWSGTAIYNTDIGTKIGTFTTPNTMSDFNLRFSSVDVSGDILLNGFVLKEILTPNCATYLDLCETPEECTDAGWFYYDDDCHSTVPSIIPSGIHNSFYGNFRGNIK